MCNQSVGLIAGVLEAAGIATVCIQLLEGVARAVAPPRALLVPYPHGYPLGEPDDPTLQHDIIAAALSLLDEESGPVLKTLGAAPGQ